MRIGPSRRVFLRKSNKQSITRRFWVIALLVVPALSFWALYQPSHHSRSSYVESRNGAGSRPTDPWAAASILASAGNTDGVVYPYSVIPGGVHSRGELESALQHDAVTAAHYAGFRVSSVKVIRLSAARQAYLSYRRGNRIYWTHKRITLPEGETLLSDGTHLARARCGNRISDTPGPDSPAEPPEEIFDHPVRPSLPAWAPVDIPAGPLVPYDPPLPLFTLNFAPPGAPGDGYAPIFSPIPCCGGGTTSGSTPSQPPPPLAPVPTPEPSTLVLVVVGAVTLLCLRAFWRS